MKRVGGTLEVALSSVQPARGLVRRLPFNAITFGHLIAAVDAAELERLRAHERVHVAQYERWGVLFFVAYPLASLGPWLRGGRAYLDNRFEVQARAGAPDVDAWSRAPSST